MDEDRASLVSGIRKLAATAGDRPAYTFVDYSADLSGPGRKRTMTWAEADYRARAVATVLRRRVPPGERAAVLAPQGLEYVVAMLGAFYARVVAVPLFTPDLPGHADRLRRIIADADPACVLTTAAAAGQVSRFLRETTERSGGNVVTVDLTVSPGDTQDPDGPAGPGGWPGELPGPDDVAYLQYTSGSTRVPAGVMITHRCLGANAAQIITGLGVEPGRATAVGWLPLFHDMGFVMTVAMPIAASGQAVFMDPAAFLMRPVRWLQLASEHTGVFTGGPNFAFEYCATKIDEAARAKLDLSGVRAFLNGAEPVRPVTLRRFIRAFEPYGLAPAALTPAYGLAEATLYVASGRPDQALRVVAFDRQALQRGEAVAVAEGDRGSIALASCGRATQQHLAVVDPRTCARCPPGQVGEIWVNGPNVAPGYFRPPPHDTDQPGEDAEVFGAVLRDAPSPAGDDLPRGGWLRTGDLGLMHEGELFMTGRLRDLIIVDGRNHYPQDVEITTQDAHPAIRRDRVAAFAVDTDGGESLVVVAERARQVSSDEVDQGEVLLAVRAAVAANHGIRLHDFRLVQPGAVPRTSSGKLARSACRDRYLTGTFGAPAGSGPR
jgi:acyl-CoA synthetase (AMP-forming)/AMP-acid ligase II